MIQNHAYPTLHNGIFYFARRVADAMGSLPPRDRAVGCHLMQYGMVDMVIVGSDRTTAAGDVCNKIGTYLKALAAKDNGILFYAAMPTSTIHQTILDGLLELPIREPWLKDR